MASTSNAKYINWLRCASSLSVLKESMHATTQQIVLQMHDNIKRSVMIEINYLGQCVSGCVSKDIEKRNSRWFINCRTCNSWLQQILRKHRYPNSNTINWSNSDIARWATEPWEIAKIFMPKGQWSNLPNELDVAALLSLHKYCTEFDHEYLVTEIIEIRNVLFHSSALKVDDADKDSWIDKMLSLLSKLNINGNAQEAIQTLKTENATFPRERELVEKSMSDLETGMKELKSQMVLFERKQHSFLAEVEKQRGGGASPEAYQLIKDQEKQLEQELQEHRNQEIHYSPALFRLQDVARNNSGLVEEQRLRAALEEVRSLRLQLERNETIFDQLKSFIFNLWEVIKRNCSMQ